MYKISYYSVPPFDIPTVVEANEKKNVKFWKPGLEGKVPDWIPHKNILRFHLGPQNQIIIESQVNQYVVYWF